ncbi:uncharacterized protein N7473_013197 [Penicillium subrubescens]|uniref:uncharacterized protein n=1 Tax=Penicillium subrubescens TaxID=1316194 RepID=UPI0025452B9C|nr:uncharacterized protein N7473_013197 [Penicillium subrubescens]KAJ5873638.1 hypothetical protein N7473_013197 [Penicillium subrubescens]
MSRLPDPSYAPFRASYNSSVYDIRQQSKAPRAQQACDQCRIRKAKCDEGRPACSHCKEYTLICVYKEVPLYRQAQAVKQLRDRIQQQEDTLVYKFSQIQSVVTDNSLQLSQLSQLIQRLLKEDPSGTIEDMDVVRNNQMVPQQCADDIMNGNHISVTKEAGELSMPAEHTTAAHKLLQWPCIRRLLKPNAYKADYVMRLEEERGLISVYGRGEGYETSGDPVTSTSLINPSGAAGEFGEHIPSPSGPWGGANQPQSKLVDIGLDDTGRVTTTPATIRRYCRSYMEHLHKLHPFLDPKNLEQKIELFITTYCPDTGGKTPGDAKRKRSCDAHRVAGRDMKFSATVMPESGSTNSIELSINNAIVLLVLALGSICEVRDRPVPGPIMDYVVDFRKEQFPRTQAPSLPTGEEVGKSGRAWMGGVLTSNIGRHNLSDQNLRNLDVIPGLAFYAYATSILGNFQGANGLPHAQAALLAGLYAGQLAHPFQSHGWIAQAARACQVLVRSNPTVEMRADLCRKTYEKMCDGPVKDLYDFAYWTCLQLERQAKANLPSSDILAELDLPASGISRYEACIALPKGRFTLSLTDDIYAPNTVMMFFHSAQIHLRKILNRVHADLYKVEEQGQTRWSSNVLKILSENLELWRASLPISMEWKDSDPPSEDINVARMRAKYYGARYIIHRPLLYLALHCAGQSNPYASSVDSPTTPVADTVFGSNSQPISSSIIQNQKTAMNMDRTYRPAQPLNLSGGHGQRTYDEPPMRLRHACKLCIDSAILSTEAFDGIKGRPVVTNIFGTAHARQFGNMLVLSATYKSHLSELVNRNDLERLLRRTIKFLLQSRYISPTLRTDARILTEIYEGIFGGPSGILAHQNE